ncbi:Type-1 restriction enzyme R protein [Escherichia coli]|nr:Type-1 restriction enzyme R protein [Escherichia coli]
MLLINGVPVVQIELKTLAVSPRRAMQQIVDYGRSRQWLQQNAAVLPAALHRQQPHRYRYFANNNARHFSFNADERFLPVYQFASEDNKKITLLDSFAEKFRQVYLGANDQPLHGVGGQRAEALMMRPYQIYAVKAIVDCIHQNCGNGYIWHTTGSGKTLTSFKASTLLKDNPTSTSVCLWWTAKTGPPDPRGIQPFSGRLRRREHQHRDPGAAYCRMRLRR